MPEEIESKEQVIQEIEAALEGTKFTLVERRKVRWGLLGSFLLGVITGTGVAAAIVSRGERKVLIVEDR